MHCTAGKCCEPKYITNYQHTLSHGSRQGRSATQQHEERHFMKYSNQTCVFFSPTAVTSSTKKLATPATTTSHTGSTAKK